MTFATTSFHLICFGLINTLNKMTILGIVLLRLFFLHIFRIRLWPGLQLIESVICFSSYLFLSSSVKYCCMMYASIVLCIMISGPDHSLDRPESPIVINSNNTIKSPNVFIILFVFKLFKPLSYFTI